MTGKQKRMRRALLVRRAAAAKKSQAMREYWQRKRGVDDPTAEPDDDNAGSPDAELADLPFLLDEK